MRNGERCGDPVLLNGYSYRYGFGKTFQFVRYIKKDSFILTLRGNTDHGPHPYYVRPDLAGREEGRASGQGAPSFPP